VKLLSLLFFASVVSLALVACGGGDGDRPGFGGPSDPDPTASDADGGDGGGAQGSEADLEVAARASFEAFLAGDDQTYFQAIVRSCREEAGFAGVSEWNKGRRALATRGGGINLGEVRVTSVAIDSFDGSGAMVTLVIKGTGDANFKEALPRPWTYDDGAWRSEDCKDFLGGTDFGESSRDDPLGLGFIADLSGWLIVVKFIQPLGDDLVLEESSNEPPADGNQYFVVSVSATYNGAESSVVFGEDLELTFVAGNKEYGEDASCGTVPGEMERDREYGPGDDAFGLICREVNSDDADSMLLRVKATDGSREAWFSLKQ
jgi:hypothetical protein